MYIRYYHLNCPHCGRIHSTTLSQRPTRLGTGQTQCKTCKQIFNDGSGEWESLTNAQKFFFLIPNGAMIWLGLGLLLMVTAYSRGNDKGAAVIVTIVLAGMAPFWLVQWYRIKQSGQRAAIAMKKKVWVMTCPPKISPVEE